MQMMKAAVFEKPGRIILQERPKPKIGPTDALMRVTTTTICGTDVHILKGEYPVAPGRIVGHEPVGVIEELGSAVVGYKPGQRVIAGAITPCGQCSPCLEGHLSQCGGKAMGGWRFGNTIDGCQAEYVLVPNATANLAPIPDGLSDEQVLMCPDIMSTGFGGAESGAIRIGDTVAVFAQGPIGLCATAGAKLRGASTIIAVDTLAERLAMAQRMGADVVIDYKKSDPVAKIMRLTGGRGVDVAIEALGSLTDSAECTTSRLREGVAAARELATKKLRVFPDLAAPIRARMQSNQLSEPSARLLVERGVRKVEGGFVWSSDPRLTLPSLQRLTEDQVRDLIAGIGCPTHVIFADPPQSYLPEPLRSERARLLPHGTLKVIQGTHHLHMEQPQDVAAAIGDFFLS